MNPCKTCKYFVTEGVTVYDIDKGRVGECRRNPPHPTHGHPILSIDHCCGEHKSVKKNKPNIDPSDNAIKCANLLIRAIKRNFPNMTIRSTEKQWAVKMEKLSKIHKIPWNKVSKAIINAHTSLPENDFWWARNVLSPEKVFKHIESLLALNIHKNKNLELCK